MIQRIQSVFLLLVGLCMLGTLPFPLWQKTAANQSATLTAFSLEHGQNGAVVHSQSAIYIGGLAVLTAGLAFYSLLQYRNRRRQMMLGAINSLLIAVCMASILWLISRGENGLNPAQEGHRTVAAYLPLAALFLNWLANFFIRKDERLVRSADRLR